MGSFVTRFVRNSRDKVRTETYECLIAQAALRCGTLLAVDDTVAELSQALDDLHIANNTYFV